MTVLTTDPSVTADGTDKPTHPLPRTVLTAMAFRDKINCKSNSQGTPLKFAVCIESDDADLLTPRMIYQVLPDDDAAKSGYLRVMDNEGEDYLYPDKYFMMIDLPDEVGRALARAA